MVLTQDELLKEMQSRELDILQACIEVCQAHNIRYYALGGTLLGAVRHKGFIPWDDDIDIGIPRKDYQRFIEVMKNIEGSAGIRIEPNMVNYNILQVLGDEKIKYNGKYIQPFIDIFPLDGYPSSGIKKWIHSKRILWNRLLFKLSILSQVANVDRGSLENLIVKVSRALRIEKTLDTKHKRDYNLIQDTHLCIHSELIKLRKGSEYDRKLYHSSPKSSRKEVACSLRYHASESNRKSF